MTCVIACSQQSIADLTAKVQHLVVDVAAEKAERERYESRFAEREEVIHKLKGQLDQREEHNFQLQHHDVCVQASVAELQSLSQRSGSWSKKLEAQERQVLLELDLIDNALDAFDEPIQAGCPLTKPHASHFDNRIHDQARQRQYERPWAIVNRPKRSTKPRSSSIIASKLQRQRRVPVVKDSRPAWR